MFQQYRKGLLLGALAAVALSTSPAHAQVSPAQVTSSETVGMRYDGGTAANDVRITLSGSTFTIDDVVPISIGDGCDPVTGDSTKARCLAPKSGTRFEEFFVALRDGNDKVVNATSTSSVLGAPMSANGGPGDDELVGDFKADDSLLGSNDDDELRDTGGRNSLTGGSGDDDLFGGAGTDELIGGIGNDTLDGGLSSDVLRGGANDDTLDGGPQDDQLEGGFGRDVIDGGPTGVSSGEQHDIAIYANRANAITVDLDRTDASQGEQPNPALGIPGEGDTIRDVEDVSGGAGRDLLLGNAFNNRLSGGAGNDTLAGDRGLDVLVGGDDDDTIFPSPPPTFDFPFGAVPDGRADIVDCGEVGPRRGDPGDQAFRVVVDRDVVIDCETTVDQ